MMPNQIRSIMSDSGALNYEDMNAEKELTGLSWLLRDVAALCAGRIWDYHIGHGS